MRPGFRISLFLIPLLFAGGCKPKRPAYVDTAFKTSVGFVYTRPEVASVKIPVHTNMTGLSGVLKTAMVEVLNQLPLAHVRLIKRIATMPINLGASNVEGVAADAAARYIPSDRSVIVDTSNPMYRDPGTFRQSLAHEIGHAVQFQMLSNKENAEWLALHKRSTDSRDYISWVAEHGTSGPDEAGDDFAETYASWAKDSNWQARRAVDQARGGKPVLLQKLLFAAATFANSDGSVTSYSEGLVDPNGTAVSVAVPLAIPASARLVNFAGRQSAVRTANSLTLGGYIYWLNGKNITKITDLDGRLILDNVSIEVPQIVFDRIPLSGTPLAIQRAANNIVSGPVGTAIHTAGARVMSPRTPDQYTPLMSPEGYGALASEQALGNPNHTLTLEDQIRPHGNFSITSTQTPR